MTSNSFFERIGEVITMKEYLIQKVDGDNNLHRLFLKPDCNSDINSVCLEVLPLFDEGRGSEFVIENDKIATIITL